MSHIGHIGDYPDNSSTSIQEGHLSLLVIKRGDELFLYENRCPHVHDSLDPMGGSTLTPDASLIVCQRHGAEFLSHTGECVGGPCLGESLRAVPFTLSGGDIYLD